MTGRRASFGAGVAVIAAAKAGLGFAASADVGVLPSPTSPIRVSPPLVSPQPVGVGGVTERQLPGRVTSTQRVRVTVDAEGRPQRIVALDRLVVTGTGDYSFSIPAPAEDALAAPGSQSEPGLRAGAVLWRGFSTRRRVLASEVTLQTRLARDSLPLRIAVRRGARTKLSLENATRTVTKALAGRASAAAVGRELDSAFFAVSQRLSFTPTYLQLVGPAREQELRISLPLTVRGTYRFGHGGPVRFRAKLRDRPLRFVGAGELRQLDLTVTVPDPAAILRPPPPGTWRAYAARGGLGGDPVSMADRLLLQTSLAQQFRSFLANPDPAGITRTDYRFVLSEPAAARPDNDAGGSSGSPWVAVAIASALLLGAIGSVVLWAHS